MNKKSLLWVGKQPLDGTGAEGGDEIYDRKVTQQLGDLYDVKRHYIERERFIPKVIALSKGVPHPRYKYHSQRSVQRFREAASECDEIVVSWESFDYLAPAIDRPVSVILHNVMSDALTQIFPRSFAARIAAAQSRNWERRIYSQPNVTIVALSRRDYNLIKAIAPSKQAFIAPPGAPPAAFLETHLFIPEIVISGSYEWMPKKRDLMLISKEFDLSKLEFCFRNNTPFPDSAQNSRLSQSSRLISEANFSEGIRIGLLPDTFLAGFKLKASFYIANNCLIASRADIRSEFVELPHYQEFVHFVRSLHELDILIRDINEKAKDTAFFERWFEFKKSCMTKFSWRLAAESICAALVRE
jgi:hypothetical protein